jgi:hypothetical protein
MTTKNKTKEGKKENDAWKSKVAKFESGFESDRNFTGRSPTNCVKGSCTGWSIKGEYFTFSDPKGDTKLDMKVKTSAPISLNSTINEASFFISDDHKETFFGAIKED